MRTSSIGFLLFLALLLSPRLVPAALAQCADYRDFLHWEELIPTGVWAGSICASDDYAYAMDTADGYCGLVVIDITSTPSRIVGRVDFPGIGYDVSLHGDHVWVAAGHGGLVAVDVSDPTNPTVAGTASTPGWAVGIAIQGDVAYVADGNGFQVVAIHNPQSPQLYGHLSWSAATGVAVAGTHAYVVDPEFGLRIVDVTKPSYPTLVGSLELVGCVVSRVELLGQFAIIASNYSLDVVDVSNPYHPQLVGDLQKSQGYPWFFDLALVGSLACVADMSTMQVVDLSDPTSPHVIGSVPVPGESYGVAVSGGRAYLASGPPGVQVVNITNPESVPILGAVYTGGYARDLVLSGPYGFVAGYTGGLSVVDVSNPADPLLVTRLPLPSPTMDTDLSGAFLYAATHAGLYVLDVSDPPNPVVVGTLPLSGITQGVTAVEDYAYVGQRDSGTVRIIDVSDPHSPTEVSELVLAETSTAACLVGTHLYFAVGEQGIQVADVSDPEHPAIIGQVAVPGQAVFVTVTGDRAYVSKGDGLVIYDATDPGNLFPIGEFSTPWQTRGVAVSGNVAYVACGDIGSIAAIDVEDPAAPVLLGELSMPWGGAGGPVVREYLYLPDGQAGLDVLPLQCTIADVETPQDFGRQVSVFPNPTSGSTRLALSPNLGGRVTLTIFDCAGRVVRHLFSGVPERGMRTFEWGGDDDDGRPVTSGVYFLEVRTPDTGHTRSLVVIR